MRAVDMVPVEIQSIAAVELHKQHTIGGPEAGADRPHAVLWEHIYESGKRHNLDNRESRPLLLFEDFLGRFRALVTSARAVFDIIDIIRLLGNVHHIEGRGSVLVVVTPL